MSERRTAALLCALLAFGTAARAQTVAQYRARVARLDAEQRLAATAQRRADSTRMEQVPAETLRVGGLTLWGHAALVNQVRDGADSAWRLLETKFGSQARRAADLEFVLQAPGFPDLVPRASNARVRPMLLPDDVTQAQIAHMMAMPAAMTISEAQDVVVRQWLGGSLGPYPAQRARLTEAYVELATSPWTAVRTCYLGDVSGCRRALGLVAEMDLLDQWYAPEDRPLLVATVLGFGWRAGRGADLVRCRDARDAAACTAVLRTVPIEYIQPPLSASARSTVVDLALELGSRNAYDRLATSRGPMDARFAAAAGVPTDSVLRAWRARLFARAPKPVTVYAAGAWAAVLWAAVWGVVGLRSSRWR